MKIIKPRHGRGKHQRADRDEELVERDQISGLIQAMEQRREPGKDFKTSTFEGTGDAEYFIRQFDEVPEANDWGGAFTRLHLKEAIKDSAKDCVKAEETEQIFAACRVQVGLTAREATSSLTSIRKETKTD